MVLQRYAVLLRGINVGGHKIIKMAELRKVLEEEGFTAVKTYIQSGNIVLETPLDTTQKVELQISRIIHEHFGHEVKAFARNKEELEKLYLNNPFKAESEEDPKMPYVNFYEEELTREQTEALEQFNQSQNDRLEAAGRHSYLMCYQGYGRTKLGNPNLEKRLKCQSTNRNWRTVLKLSEMMGLEFK